MIVYEPLHLQAILFVSEEGGRVEATCECESTRLSFLLSKRFELMFWVSASLLQVCARMLLTDLLPAPATDCSVRQSVK